MHDLELRFQGCFLGGNGLHIVMLMGMRYVVRNKAERKEEQGCSSGREAKANMRRK